MCISGTQLLEPTPPKHRIWIIWSSSQKLELGIHSGDCGIGCPGQAKWLFCKHCSLTLDLPDLTVHGWSQWGVVSSYSSQETVQALSLIHTTHPIACPLNGERERERGVVDSCKDWRSDETRVGLTLELVVSLMPQVQVTLIVIDGSREQLYHSPRERFLGRASINAPIYQ